MQKTDRLAQRKGMVMGRKSARHVGVTKHGGGWRIRWLDEHGVRQSLTLTDQKTAQVERARRVVEVDEIKRGVRRRDEHRTVGDALDLWLERRAPLKRSREDDQSMARVHIRPFFGGIKLRDITPADGERFYATKPGLSPKTAHNIVTLVQSILIFARDDLRWVEKVPRLRKPKITRRANDYNFLRTPAEIARYLRAAREEGELVHVLYALAVYTGMRAGEIAALRWDDIDFNQRLITVARSFTTATKSGEIRRVPILDALLPVLRAWRLRHPGKLVFTNRDGRMFGKSARVFQEVHARVLKRAGLTDPPRVGGRKRYVTFHDLRHTFASHWAMGGGDIFKLQKILGHASIDQTNGYTHLCPAAFGADYARLGPSLDPVDAEIVALHPTG